jgi:hypothetical protein
MPSNALIGLSGELTQSENAGNAEQPANSTTRRRATAKSAEAAQRNEPEALATVTHIRR